MRRREFITLVGGTAVAFTAWPLAARAQPRNIATIGYFSGRSADEEEEYRAAILRGLEKMDLVEGRNVKIEYRFSNGQDDRLPAIARPRTKRSTFWPRV
jgi:putative ABC transport system substrate-binding protein